MFVFVSSVLSLLFGVEEVGLGGGCLDLDLADGGEQKKLEGKFDRRVEPAPGAGCEHTGLDRNRDNHPDGFSGSTRDFEV